MSDEAKLELVAQWLRKAQHDLASAGIASCGVDQPSVVPPFYGGAVGAYTGACESTSDFADLGE
jgi:hypothetical protein